ncbi:peptidoglycan DD-metalloendopeptidase family protein [Amphritea sp. 2_MG-2023]|uniref:peptidoglycan DD-metalloendopeptidase family protein n=1 Tax=Amphritea TaxID=515417 RepID=UPI001C07DE83|nr:MULTISPECIES: peptidoglycan DD-metalloendopeptidase family protein [Amphritea]MBU2964878.1 peptidoglycan DD-metalloendopeptidase family protein [Amphritea atlantica]MDO6419959.1 peptidoglycan DD-metalloendopeptidase family protein [Amphritea sp. 2_MG-2023]
MVRAHADPFITTALLVVVLMLSACSSSSRYTPIDERSIGGRQPVKVVSSQPPPGQYRVRRGDTLYSIAFRYGLDFRQLAKRNNISDRYQIYPGQVLSLKASALRPTQASSSVKPIKKSTSVEPAKTTKPTKPVTRTTTKKVVAAPVVASKKSASTNVNKSTKPASTRALSWRWPTSGQIIQRFSNKGKVNKGINFAGRKGAPVYAAEAGEVVYAGSGLLGYGNLVIIHHNQKFLSAYAHNSRILVKENDKVKTGDKIAEIGNSGAARTMLHFEIRRDGQPVDPMLYLPRKR